MFLSRNTCVFKQNTYDKIVKKIESEGGVNKLTREDKLTRKKVGRDSERSQIKDNCTSKHYACTGNPYPDALPIYFL